MTNFWFMALASAFGFFIVFDVLALLIIVAVMVKRYRLKKQLRDYKNIGSERS